MDFVKSIALSLLFSLVITGVISLLVPKNSMQKTMKFAINVFFICSIVTPFVTNSVDFDLFKTEFQGSNSHIENEDLNKSIQSSLSSIAVTSMENNITSSLMLNKIPVEKVIISVNISDDNSIDITNVKVIVSDSDIIDVISINNVVENAVGVSPEIEKAKEGS